MLYTILESVLGSRVGAVVRALASHQCVPGSIPGPGVMCGLSLLLVLYSAPRGFSAGTPVSPLLKNQHFQIAIRSGNARPRLNEFFELLGAPWVNKLHLFFYSKCKINLAPFLSQSPQALWSAVGAREGLRESENNYIFLFHG